MISDLDIWRAANILIGQYADANGSTVDVWRDILTWHAMKGEPLLPLGSIAEVCGQKGVTGTGQ